MVNENLIREANRICTSSEANGYDDRGTCVLGAGVRVNGRQYCVRCRRVT